MSASRPANLARPYFQSIALPNYREFLTAQTDLRRAWNAGVSLAHTIDYMAADAGEDADLYRQALIDAHPPLEVPVRLCNALKHVEASRGTRGGPPFISAWEINVPAPDEVLWVDELEDGGRREFRRSMETEFLYVPFRKEGKTRPIWIGAALYGATRQLAINLDCESLLGHDSFPDVFNLVYRDVPATVG